MSKPITATDTLCPNCGDKISDTTSNMSPTWSDYFDNIVCWWCAAHPHETDNGDNQ